MIDELAYPGLDDAAFAVLELRGGRALHVGTGAGGRRRLAGDSLILVPERADAASGTAGP